MCRKGVLPNKKFPDWCICHGDKKTFEKRPSGKMDRLSGDFFCKKSSQNWDFFFKTIFWNWPLKETDFSNFFLLKGQMWIFHLFADLIFQIFYEVVLFLTPQFSLQEAFNIPLFLLNSRFEFLIFDTLYRKYCTQL